MTGQVKEDILCRFGELGVFVKNGCINFNPRLLRKNEFLKSQASFNYVNIDGKEKQLQLENDTLCFTYCQVPVIYKISDQDKLVVKFSNGVIREFDSLLLEPEISKEIFQRTASVDCIEVGIIGNKLL
jgi:hypothetical protein